MESIIRKKYLDKLSILKDKNFIKVATGVRRCGKSTLMLQFQDLLRTENPNVSILSINLDMPDFRFLGEKNWKEIYDYIVENLDQKEIAPIEPKCKDEVHRHQCVGRISKQFISSRKPGILHQ